MSSIYYCILYTLFKNPTLIKTIDISLLDVIFQEPRLKALYTSLKETIFNYVNFNAQPLFTPLNIWANKLEGSHKEFPNRQSVIKVMDELLLPSNLLLPETFEQAIKTEYSRIKKLEATTKIYNLSNILSDEIRKDKDCEVDEDFQTHLKSLYTELETLESFQEKTVYSMEEAVGEYIKALDTESSNGERRFFDKTFDDALQWGAEAGEVGILAGASSQGKSARVLNLLNNLISNDVPTFYFSTEMSLKSVFNRLICSRLGTTIKMIKQFIRIYHDIKSKEGFDIEQNEALQSSNAEERAEVLRLLRRLNSDLEVLKEHYKKFRFCEKGDISLKEIELEIRKFQGYLPSKDKYVFVIIDLLSMIKDFKEGSGALSIANRAEIAIDKLNAMAKRLGIHVLGVVQLNRESDNIKVRRFDDLDKLRPTRNNIKNSASYLERSRYTFLLFRKKSYAISLLGKKYKEQIDKMEDISELILVKASNDALSTKKEIYIPDKFTFVPYDEPDIAPDKMRAELEEDIQVDF